VPLQDMTSWQDIVERDDLKRGQDGTDASTLCFRNVYFLDDMTDENDLASENIPHYLHMLRVSAIDSSTCFSSNNNHNLILEYDSSLQHTYRSRYHTEPKKYIKCFHKTSATVLVHNHLPLACIGGHGFGQCTVLHLEPDVAHMQHYRSTCVSNAGVNCTHFKSETVKDQSIWKYKQELTLRVQKAMSDIWTPEIAT